MIFFKVTYDDLTVEELGEMINDDELPDYVLHYGARLRYKWHKRVDRVRDSVAERKFCFINKVRRIVGKPPLAPKKAMEEPFSPDMLVRDRSGDDMSLARCPTNMSTISASSIVSLTPSRLSAVARESGSSESVLLQSYLEGVYMVQPPRLTDVDDPLFSVNMVNYIRKMQREHRFLDLFT